MEFNKWCEAQNMRRFFAMSADKLRELIAVSYAKQWDADESLGAHETKMSMALRAIALRAAQAADPSPDPVRAQRSIPILDLDPILDPIGVSVITPSNSDQAVAPKRSPMLRDPDFLALKAFYPARTEGTQSWVMAYKLFRRAIKNGHSASEILDGVHRYRKYCEETGVEGTDYVQTVVRFLSQKNWRASWEVVDKQNPHEKPLPPSADELRRRRERRVPRGTKS